MAESKRTSTARKRTTRGQAKAGRSIKKTEASKASAKRSVRGTAIKRTRKTKKKQTSFTIPREIKGLIICVLAVMALVGDFGYSAGSLGRLWTGLFQYSFGITAFIPILTLFAGGFYMCWTDTKLVITRRMYLFAFFYILLITYITLWGVPENQEFATTRLADYGGLIGGLCAYMMRTFGNAGAIILDTGLIVAAFFCIFRLSVRTGLHKAGKHTAAGIERVREAAEEHVHDVKERIEDWQEQKRQERQERRAYNQEQDKVYKGEGLTNESKSQLVENNDESLRLSAYKDAGTHEIESMSAVEETVTPVEDSRRDGSNESTSFMDRVEEAGEDRWHDKEPVDWMKEDSLVANNSVEDDHAEGWSSDRGLTNPHIASKYRRESYISDEVSSTQYPPMDDGMTSYASSELEPVYKEELAQGIVGEADSLAKESIRPAPSRTTGIEQTANEGVLPISEPLVPKAVEDTMADRAEVSVSTEGTQPRRAELMYHYPPLAMLSKGEEGTVSQSEIAQNAATLESTLKSFGITAKVVNATQGPTVTRYELEPAPGTKVSRILNLTDDLKLNLAATDIRMEAPIPGKAAIGIEVPNKVVTAVHLRDVLDSDEFRYAKGGIPVGLGKDIAGKAVITDLAKMPHLLVAGSTGSGKSVCVNTLIASILFSRNPEEVKLILVDPKMVELSVYNGIPHLMVPVVTDMKKAATVLRWAVREMDSRYRTLSTVGLRDIKKYNEMYPKTAMPLILIIIDELADLMLVAPDVEESINRLAAKARAAGIHMVLATQRPSVNVITGTIKANIPSRISFAVATQVDSRTILDMAGAEKLLGKGDMLFNPIGASKPLRIQGAFISDEEVESLVAFIKKQGQATYDTSVITEEEETEAEEAHHSLAEQDEYLERAVDLVMSSGQASVSMLQRRFRIGYTRAARLVDTMEELGIVGPNQGSKARDILMSKEEAQALFNKKTNE